MKPHEETWDRMSDIKTPETRQLAIAAPEMARLLLDLLRNYELGQALDDRIHDVLLKAGIS